MTAIILGCGYTGGRVARRMLSRGAQVICTSRSPDRLTGLDGALIVPLSLPSEGSLDFIPENSFLLHSIPPVDGLETDRLFQRIAERHPRRVVYLSTTGVYGAQKQVEAATHAAPRHAQDFERLKAESATLSGPWSGLVLRPAAIYGPGRGIHVSMAAGRFHLVGDGSNYVSRIHVDDLAAHVEAAFESDLEGAWPVADEYPCTSREIAEFCGTLLGRPLPASIPAEAAHHTRRADRRVDGTAVRAHLGVRLAYPDFRSGIRASLEAEQDSLK